jgi:hypothetical protein
MHEWNGGHPRHPKQPTQVAVKWCKRGALTSAYSLDFATILNFYKDPAGTGPARNRPPLSLRRGKSARQSNESNS